MRSQLLPGDQRTRRRLAQVIDLQGVNWLSAQNPSAAHSCFAESCKLDPVSSSYWVHQCVSAVQCGDFDDALRCVEQAMSVEKAPVRVELA